MNRKSTLLRTIVATTALVAGMSGLAHADDNSLSPFGGDSYRYFNEAQPAGDKTQSTFRQQNPKGLSERDYQALSNEDPVWQPAVPIDRTASTFHATNPHGIPYGEYQALASNDSMWQPRTSGPGSATVASSGTARARFASLFHLSPADRATN